MNEDDTLEEMSKEEIDNRIKSNKKLKKKLAQENKWLGTLRNVFKK